MEKRVLVIDNAVFGWSRCSDLVKQGYSVDVAPTADDGLRRLSTQGPDVIILQEAAGARSWQVCERIRRVSAKPLMVISPDATPETSVKALMAGADYFIRQPFGPRELSARVGSLLRRTPPCPAPQCAQPPCRASFSGAKLP